MIPRTLLALKYSEPAVIRERGERDAPLEVEEAIATPAAVAANAAARPAVVIATPADTAVLLFW